MIDIINNSYPSLSRLKLEKDHPGFSFPNEQLEMIAIIIEQDINHCNARCVFNNFMLL